MRRVLRSSLPRLVGDARALGLTLLGDKLPAERAAAWGMIWQCVDDAELVPTVGGIVALLGWERPIAVLLDPDHLHRIEVHDRPEALDGLGISVVCRV